MSHAQLAILSDGLWIGVAASAALYLAMRALIWWANGR